MTHVYFVRHAEPNYNNHNDLTRELTEKGLSDRKLATSYLADKSIDIALSSPYIRSIDTIKDFADAYNLTITTIEDFKERKIDSCWIEDFNSFARKQWEDFSYKLSDGESLDDVQKRNISALNQVLQTYDGKNIVIGSHGTALSTIINYYQPAFLYSQFEQIKGLMPWIVHFVFDGNECIKIESVNLFTNTAETIYHFRD